MSLTKTRKLSDQEVDKLIRQEEVEKEQAKRILAEKDANMSQTDEDEESLSEFSELETFSQFSVRQEKKRRKRLARFRGTAGGQTDTVRRTKSSFMVTVVQSVVNLFAILFILTAGLGGVLKLLGQSKGDFSPEELASSKFDESPDWRMMLEAADTAFSTTLKAAQLWSKLIWSILWPTTQTSYALSKAGVIALQPSMLVSIEWFKNASVLVKSLIIGSVLLVILSLYMYREVQERQLVEKAILLAFKPVDFFTYTYRKVEYRTAKLSLFFANLLPHAIFVTGSIALLYLFKSDLVLFSRGFGGWLFVIAIPVGLSTRALVKYDQAYNDRIEAAVRNSRKKSKRRPSFLPVPEALGDSQVDEASLPSEQPTQSVSLWGKVKRLFSPEEDTELEDDEDDGMIFRTYLADGRQRYKTQRGVRPMQYPALLDTDDKSSYEQFEELQVVLSWLKYWSILSVPLLMEQLPVTGHILDFVPYWPVARMFVSFWLYLPLTDGASLSFSLFLKIINFGNQRFRNLDDGVHTIEENRGLFLSGGRMILKMLPLKEELKIKIEEIGETGGMLLLFSLPMLMMPAFVISIGSSLLGLGSPMYSGAKAVLRVENAAIAASRRLQFKERENRSYRKGSRKMRKGRVKVSDPGIQKGPTVASGALEITKWLEYWVVYTVLMFAYGILDQGLYWFPLWAQAKMLLILWLQLPYFRGSRRIFKGGVAGYYRLRAKYFPALTNSTDEAEGFELPKKEDTVRRLSVEFEAVEEIAIEDEEIEADPNSSSAIKRISTKKKSSETTLTEVGSEVTSLRRRKPRDTDTAEQPSSSLSRVEKEDNVGAAEPEPVYCNLQ
eukprot:maker-scaffold_2-snap-gene-12.6-mRNA-1 protein AED:0.00 eAED:0.00 QI:0/0.5/0.33/0.66/1/1/3/82/836